MGAALVESSKELQLETVSWRDGPRSSPSYSLRNTDQGTVLNIAQCKEATPSMRLQNGGDFSHET